MKKDDVEFRIDEYSIKNNILHKINNDEEFAFQLKLDITL